MRLRSFVGKSGGDIGLEAGSIFSHATSTIAVDDGRAVHRSKKTAHVEDGSVPTLSRTVQWNAYYKHAFGV